MMSREITISPMTSEDIEQLAQIEQQCFSDPWSAAAFSDELENSLATYLIARDNKKCIGYCGFWNIVGECEITNVAVLPEYRGYGIASRLIEETIRFAYKNNLSVIWLEVRASNIPAQKLYQKYSFEKIGIRSNYYQNPREDAWIMAKQL